MKKNKQKITAILALLMLIQVLAQPLTVLAQPMSYYLPYQMQEEEGRDFRTQQRLWWKYSSWGNFSTF